MEETLEYHTKSLAAPIIFIVVLVFQLSDKFLAHLKKKASTSEKDTQLRAEIKQLLKEAAALSEPSTFAQSAKLRRMATAKEKELAKSQESASKEMKTSFSLYEKILMISKVVIYLIMIVLFWRIPVAAISKELVQPFAVSKTKVFITVERLVLIIACSHLFHEVILKVVNSDNQNLALVSVSSPRFVDYFESSVNIGYGFHFTPKR